MTPGTGRLPPRSALPRDVVVPALPGLGVSWYDRGPRYWMHRAALALGMAVVVAVVATFDISLFGAMRRTSQALFWIALGVDIAVSLGLIVFMVVRTARRWNLPALPQRGSRPAFRLGRGRAGAAASGLVGLLYPVLLLVVAVLLAIFPGVLIYLLVTMLMPEQPVERQARLWVTGELRRRGHLGGAGSPEAGAGRGDGAVRPDG